MYIYYDNIADELGQHTSFALCILCVMCVVVRIYELGPNRLGYVDTAISFR